MIEYPSTYIAKAIEELGRLPGVGKKSAMRLALHLLKQPNERAENLGKAIVEMKHHVKFCKKCFNVSDAEICGVCTNPNRDSATICVVADVNDFMAIENTQQYRGLYHVLGGIISPIDGIGPKDLSIEDLIIRVASGEIKEVIMALKTTVEGDTTNFYIYRKLKDFPVKISQIARGIAVGDELEYTDEITLGRSIQNRIPFDIQFKS